MERDGDHSGQMTEEERLRVVLQHAEQRIRLWQEKCRKNFSQWRRSAEEAAGLRGEMAKLAEQLRTAETQLAAATSQAAAATRELAEITGSRSFRFLQAIFGTGLRSAPRIPQETGMPLVASPPAAPVSPVAGSTVDEPPSAGKHTETASCPEEPTVPAPLVYSPLSWELPEDLSADARFLNLMILSVTGRTGSTLLQRICNARKGTLIWGEHAAILTRFADVYSTAAGVAWAAGGQRESYFGQGENPNLWIANMCPEVAYVRQAVVQSARALLNALYRQSRELHDVVGFKETGYGRSEFELLRACYPEAHFLLIVRSPVDTWKSTPRDWYVSLDEFIAQWNGRARDFHDLAHSDSRCHLIRYEDLIGREGQTLTRLGEVARVTRDQMAMVLAAKIGSLNEGLDDSERALIVENCREGMQLLDYAFIPTALPAGEGFR